MDRHHSNSLRSDELYRRLAADNLKLCPLCSAVNARQNGECFVCRWHGDFDHDPYRIEFAVQELIERCPELLEAVYRPERFKLRLSERIGLFFQRLFRRRRRLDFSV